jgi:hypothetical protein
MPKVPSKQFPTGSRKNVEMDLDRFCLGIARGALERLDAVDVPVEGGGWIITKDFVGYKDPSPHFEHAAVCTAFSRFAVQHGLERLVVLRSSFFIRRDGRPTGIELSKRPSRKELSAFLRVATNLPKEIDTEIWGLMRHRDKFAHAQIVIRPDKVVREAILPGQKPTIQRSRQFPRVTLNDVKAARKNFETAERLVDRFRKELVNKDWVPGVPTLNPGPSVVRRQVPEARSAKGGGR